MAAKFVSSGILADLQESGLALRKINKVAQYALYIACDEFFKNPQGFGLRFSPRAYSELGLSPRSSWYVKRKLKVFGRDLPNVSPARKGANHLREILKVRGSGYNLKTTAKQSVASVKITLPGARKQNQYGKNWEEYGRELLTLTGKQAWQGQIIMKRALEIFRQEIWEEFNRKNPVYWSA